MPTSDSKQPTSSPTTTTNKTPPPTPPTTLTRRKMSTKILLAVLTITLFVFSLIFSHTFAAMNNGITASLEPSNPNIEVALNCPTFPYSSKRLYGLPSFLNSPSESPPFLRDALYIRGAKPFIINPSSSSSASPVNKLCPVFDGTEVRLNHVTNPSTIFFTSPLPSLEEVKYLTTAVIGSHGQCNFPSKNPPGGGGERKTVVMLLNVNFEVVVQLDLFLTSRNKGNATKWGKRNVKAGEVRALPLSDIKVFEIAGDGEGEGKGKAELYISYYNGKEFGFLGSIVNRLYIGPSPSSSSSSPSALDDATNANNVNPNKAYEAFILAEDTHAIYPGKNFAYFMHESAGPSILEWVLPPKFRLGFSSDFTKSRVTEGGDAVAASGSWNEVIAAVEKNRGKKKKKIVKYRNPKLSIHGTPPSLIYIPATKEYLSLPHIHRPSDRDSSEFAIHGHHYTHFFVTFDSDLKVRRIGGEFCFRSLTTDGSSNLDGNESESKSEKKEEDCDLIQFASGLSFDPSTSKVLVSYGINDCEGAAVLLDWKDIDRILGEELGEVGRGGDDFFVDLFQKI